jgi:hypothetical protein
VPKSTAQKMKTWVVGPMMCICWVVSD